MKKKACKTAVPNIIILTLSGVSNRDIFELNGLQNSPNLHDLLLPQGILFKNLLTVNYAFHQPEISSMNTGMLYSQDYVVRKPSFFQYFNKQYAYGRSKVWTIGYWYRDQCVKKTVLFKESSFPCQAPSQKFCDLYSRELLMPYLDDQEKKTFKALEEYLADKNSQWPQWDGIRNIHDMIFWKVLDHHKPKIVHYIMQDTEAAHYGSYARYRQMIRCADSRLKKIFKYVNTDEFYKNNTYLFVSVDHERNNYHMDHEDLDVENPRPTWLFVFGPGVPKAKTCDRRIYHVDVFATLAKILLLKTHRNFGRVLSELFINS
jgi:hypothetical protein